MIKEGISLEEQQKDVKMFREIQEEHNVTDKHFIDEYRKDIEDRITDVNLKKQAIAIVDLIENDMAENYRMQEEEYEQENAQFKPSEQEFYFLDDAKEDEEIIRGIAPDQLHNNVDDEKEPLNEPLHVLTEEEKEAIAVLTAFNRESRERDYESLENIESTTTNNSQNTATLKVNEGLNTAKEGLNSFKNVITSKIENVDAEKLDENWQKFWLMACSILKGFLDIATVVAIAIYKIPAKRHFKKKLDYTINEVTGKDLKSMMEIQQNEMKHRFFVDWLPKTILILSAILIYNNVWNVGLVAFSIGLIYYMFSYLTFDYGGSNLLNVLAENMDKQGIRLKDSYFNNMIVLYRYFDEYQKTMGVTIDERGKIEIVEDKELGSILKFYVNEDKNTNITSITDYRLTYYKVYPFLDEYNNNAKLQNKRQVAVMLDQILLMAINQDEDVSSLYAKKEEFWDCFPELRGLADQRRAEEDALRQEQADNVFYADIAKKSLSERAVSIIKFLRKESENLGMSPHDLNGLGIKGNNDYLKVRMHLNQGTTYAQAKAKLAYIGSKTGLIPKIIEITTTDSSIYLMFYLNKSLKSRAMTIEEIKEEGKKGIFTLGKGYLGDYTTKIPREDQPFFVLVGGLSRSGKSTLATRLLGNTTYLQDENGFYDYQDYFISSVKDEDYTANGFKQSGMFVTGSPEETYNMLCLVDKIATERKELFLENDVINIKQYNKKFKNNKMGKIMLVMDEYANLFRACGSRKIETENGKMKLKDAIEERLVKINAEHGSRGVSSIVITQNFMKEEVGKVRDTIEAKILGNAEGNVWSSYDNTGEIGKIMQKKSEEVQGVFLMNSKAFQPLKGVETDVVQGFIETKTHFIDTEDILEGFDRTYETAAKYTALIVNADNSVSEDVQEVVSYNLNDYVETEETALNETKETKEIFEI